MLSASEQNNLAYDPEHNHTFEDHLLSLHNARPELMQGRLLALCNFTFIADCHNFLKEYQNVADGFSLLGSCSDADALTPTGGSYQVRSTAGADHGGGAPWNRQNRYSSADHACLVPQLPWAADPAHHPFQPGSE